MVKFKPTKNRAAPAESIVVGGSAAQPAAPKPAKVKLMKGSQISESGGPVKNPILVKPLWKKLLPVFLATILIGALVTGFWFVRKQHAKNGPTDKPIDKELALTNKYLAEGNPKEALVHAKKSLQLHPNNMDAILNVADIAEKANATEESKQLYSQALTEFKKQDNPDENGKPARTYWAAASLAEGAGDKEQAIKYYKQAIAAASPSDPDDQNVVAKSSEALKRLQ